VLLAGGLILVEEVIKLVVRRRAVART